MCFFAQRTGCNRCCSRLSFQILFRCAHQAAAGLESKKSAKSGARRLVWALCGLIAVALKYGMACFSLCDENHRLEAEVHVGFIAEVMLRTGTGSREARSSKQHSFAGILILDCRI